MAALLTGSLAPLVDLMEKAGFVNPEDLAFLLGPESEARLRELNVPIPLRRSFLDVCSQQAGTDESAQNIPAGADAFPPGLMPVHAHTPIPAVWLLHE